MKRRQSGSIRDFFLEVIHESVTEKIGLKDREAEENYLSDLLVNFMHDDRIYAIRDANGDKIKSIPLMLAEGDIRLNADSFAREREVHRHIGDFILFWSGMYPSFLEQHSDQVKIDLQQQASDSYFQVSTFDHGDYAAEAPLFRHLSEEFEAYRISLNIVRTRICASP